MITARISLHSRLIIGIALTKVLSAIVQESTPAPGSEQKPAEIQALDQLIELNEQLERQNQQMERQNQQYPCTSYIFGPHGHAEEFLWR
jgi:hypothetical protein